MEYIVNKKTNKFFELKRSGKSYSKEMKALLVELSDEEWKSISVQLGPFPYKGKIADLRESLLKTRKDV